VIDQPSESGILEQRNMRYRRTPERRIQMVEDARAFVEDLGFCFLWPIKDIEMPSLFHAIAGRVRSVPMKHNDPDLSKCWGWKDRALGLRWWYYSKMLRRRATLISLDLLPYFYACSENYGGLDDYMDEYRAGTMSAEAKGLYEALLEHGPLDTVRLRREARMAAESAKTRFEKARSSYRSDSRFCLSAWPRPGPGDTHLFMNSYNVTFPICQARPIGSAGVRHAGFSCPATWTT
jgi:hypothetical protein